MKLKHYHVDVRAIDDRPTKDGYFSSGRDVPTVYVSAFNVDHALAQAHALGRGWNAGYDATYTTAVVAECDTRGDVIGEPSEITYRTWKDRWDS